MEAVAAIDHAGNWACTEFGLLVSRQQGKGEILQAYDLAHLFVWPSMRDEPKVILHTAHEFATVDAHYRKLKRRIMGTPWMRKRLKGGGKETAHGVSGISTGMGRRTFELEDGTLLVLATRTGNAGVGLTVDVLIVDEAQQSPAETMEALLFTQDAVLGSQTLYTGTVPTANQDGEHFEALRDRGREGTHPRTGWAEYSPEGSDDPDMADAIDITDPQVWVESNPGLGYRTSVEDIEDKIASMGRTNPEGLRKQRFSIWPNRRPVATESPSGIRMEAWNANVDPDATHGSPVTLAVSVGAGGAWSSISAASRLSDGRTFVQHEASAVQSLWVPQALKQMVDRYRATVVLDPKQAGLILPLLDEYGIAYMSMTAGEVAAAFAMTVELVNAERVVRRPQEELTASLTAAAVRSVSTYGQTWEVGDPTESITPIQSMTLALWGLHKTESQPRRTGRAVFV